MDAKERRYGPTSLQVAHNIVDGCIQVTEVTCEPFEWTTFVREHELGEKEAKEIIAQAVAKTLVEHAPFSSTTEMGHVMSLVAQVPSFVASHQREEESLRRELRKAYRLYAEARAARKKAHQELNTEQHRIKGIKAKRREALTAVRAEHKREFTKMRTAYHKELDHTIEFSKSEVALLKRSHLLWSVIYLTLAIVGMAGVYALMGGML